MKKLKIVIAASVCLAIVSCKKSDSTSYLLSADVSTDANYSTCDNVKSFSFMAGQHINVGDVHASNDDTYLFITFKTRGNWKLRHTHLFAGDCNTMPVNRNGSPKIGRFPLQTAHDPLEAVISYKIPVDMLNDRDCPCLATHAEVVLTNDQGEIIQEETAWSEGTRFTNRGGSWAMYNTYCIEACEDLPN